MWLWVEYLVSALSKDPWMKRLYEFYEHKRHLLKVKTGYEVDFRSNFKNFNKRNRFTSKLLYPKDTARILFFYMALPIALLVLLLFICIFTCCCCCCCCFRRAKDNSKTAVKEKDE